MLLARDVPGFALRNRKWRPSEDEFYQLAISKEHKQLILALVRSHSRGKLATPDKAVNIRPEMDLVRGKGKELIILLHGVPGAGKTSTAESIASFTKRPLYPITCGDLGETAREVEESLEAHFTLAHRWGCILLALSHKLFTIFLRVLEYYPGILFLTTNRVGSFDEAFKSRIHIALYYPPLSREFTMQVWNSCLAQIGRQNAQRDTPVEFDRSKLLDFAEEQYNSDTPWNGRQIRNAFQTAIALAEYERAEKRHEKLRKYNVDDEGELSDSTRSRFQKRFAIVPLTKSHFRQVATAFTKFESYMLEVQQQTDADRAEIDGLRADGWNPNEETPIAHSSTS
ncbi:P-loop containing nucleoside triphosphate hydrolase protein [Aspergillus insuetus]